MNPLLGYLAILLIFFVILSPVVDFYIMKQLDKDTEPFILHSNGVDKSSDEN
jgi:hypothetical protein